MKIRILFLLMVMTILVKAQQKPYYQQHAKYTMNIDVEVKNFSYHGNQKIEYTNNSPDELNEVYFHLYWNAFKPNSMMDHRVRNQGNNADGRLATRENGNLVSRLASIPKDEEGLQKINWIKQNGKPVRFEVQQTVLKVYLNEKIKPNTKTIFTMDWDAVVPKQIRRSGRNNREGIDFSMSQWYPKLAEYDYDGWATFDYIGREFHAPFADYEVNISIDKDYVIGAGGTLLNPSEVKDYTKDFHIKTNSEGKATWKWTAKNILDFAWGADPDYSVEEAQVPQGPKLYFVYQKNDKTKLWEETKPLMVKYFQLMNAHFGRYPYPSYSFIQGGDGGMEYGMCTLMLGEGKDLKSVLGLMVHEATHSWYQHMLATNESMRHWMDEGFTSYAEDFVMHKLLPPNEPIPNPYMENIQRYIDFTKTGKEQPAGWLADHYDSGQSYTMASYIKGELFLVHLGYILGEETVSKILQKYYYDWSMKHPTDRDFMHIAQKVSGMDLKWFHHYWINTTKTIDYAIKEVIEKDNETQIILVNKGEVPMPIDFSLVKKDGKLIHYHIPLNMMRSAKKSDYFGGFSVQPYWNWTEKEYRLNIPLSKKEIQAMGIDFSKRMADVNPSDNFLELK